MAHDRLMTAAEFFGESTKKSAARRVLTVDDPTTYPLIYRALNEVFGKDYRGYQRCTWNTDKNDFDPEFVTWAWFVRVGFEGTRMPGGRGEWQNEVDHAITRLTETAPVNKAASAPRYAHHPRVVFAWLPDSDGFKFIGVFKYNGSPVRCGNTVKCVYERVATEYTV